MRLTLAEVLQSIDGECHGRGAPDLSFPAVSTDTRNLQPGSLFVAIHGERYDAHDFVGQAAAAGAAALVVHRDLPAQPVPVLRVADTLTALGAIARHVRRRQGLRVLAITGSVGKTTTKEMAAALLRAQGRRVVQSPGNWNNRVGLPLTLLSANGDEEAAVLELGISEPGEMSALTRICEPDVAVVTAAAMAHTEGLGSVEQVAREKLAIAEGLAAAGVLVLPHGDSLLRPTPGVKTVTFGWEAGADLHATGFRNLGPDGCRFVVDGQPFRLRLPGRHNATNALAALAGARALGYGLEEASKALSELRPAPLRGEHRTTRGGAHLIVDCYNANPSATTAALETLRDLATTGRKVAILGEMRELGRWTESAHAEVGRAAVRAGVDELHLLGAATTWVREGAAAAGLAPERIWLYGDREALAAAVSRRLRQGDWVLIKGSRALGLEFVAQTLEENGADH